MDTGDNWEIQNTQPGTDYSIDHQPLGGMNIVLSPDHIKCSLSLEDGIRMLDKQKKKVMSCYEQLSFECIFLKLVSI